ncbi:MAG: apolipoprotein N-acyltransferase [Candidatus Omnitrophota bacterium]
MLRKVVQLIVQSSKLIVKELLLCLLSAVLLILSFPDFNLEFLAWFAFVPAFFTLNNKTGKQAFLLFFITGVAFWSGIIYWLVHVTLAGTAVLILYLALYFGVFGLLIRPFTKRSTPYLLIFIPSAWVLLEYIRGYLFTGFPWALLGYSQYLNLPVIQIADITGVWGVSFLVMMVNVMIYSVFGSRFSVLEGIKKYFSVILCIFVTLSYGYYKIQRAANAEQRTPIKVSVIQGNILQELKWDKISRDFIMNEYFAISDEALKDEPDLIIWPEAALPVVLEEEPAYYERVRDFIKARKTPLLLGAATLRDDIYYNSALLVSGEGKLVGRYDKLHLVPFGEYIPLRDIYSFLETIVPIGDFSAGKEKTVFTLPTPNSQLPAKFSVLICFEDLFPDLSRGFVKNGAGFLVNITNDAWFKTSSSPYQHLSASVFRAVENRVFLVRSANTGVSGFILASGKIVSPVKDKYGNKIFISGYGTKDIFVSTQENSFYTRYGDLFMIICALLAGTAIFMRRG